MRLTSVLAAALLPVFLFAQEDFRFQKILPSEVVGPIAAPKDSLLRDSKNPAARDASGDQPRAVYTSSDDRMNATPTEWYVYSGQTPAQVTDTINNYNLRLVDIYVENTSPYIFSGVYVKNTGAYAKGWWWYYGVDAAGLSSLLSTNNARLIALKAYDIGSGQIRFAAIMIPNTGADAKGWWWYYGQTTAQLTTLWQANNARIVHVNSYVSGGQTYYAAIMISNTGADNSGWWWYVDQTVSNLVTLINNNNARIIDLDYVPSTGHYNAVMVSCAGGCPLWWWYVGQTGQQLLDLAAQNGSRIIDINTYPGCGGSCYSFAMIDNSNDITSRVGQLLRNGNDGVKGLYLKQAGGPVLANLQENFVFEPASSIKVVGHLDAMQQVQSGARALTDSIVHYINGASSCPDPASVSGVEPLSTALREMMWHSDNARTREINDTLGTANINAFATSIGMANTQINHIIGCGGPTPDTMTLSDAAKLYEGVANGSFLDVPNRNTFYSLMAGKAQFLAEGYDWTGLWSTDIPAMINQEAPAGMSAAQKQAYQNQMNLAYKAGGYTICSPSGCTNVKEYLSIAGLARLPFCSGNTASYRDYMFGVYVHGASDSSWFNGKTTVADNAFTASKAELLREQLHDGLASCSTISTVNITINTVPAGRTFSVDGITYTSGQTFAWYPGETHDVATPALQQLTGTRHSFLNWSDGLARAHTFTVPPVNGAITANFLTQHLLTLTSSPAPSAGSIVASPASGDGYYNEGAVVQLSALPNTGNKFSAWSGDLTGAVQPQNITMSAPRSVTATFVSIVYPDLGLTKSHSGSFLLGGNGVFSLAVHNFGIVATTGGISVTDTLPAGLTFVSGTGGGWNCSAASQLVTCTNPGPVNSAATSTITLTVKVGALAYPSVSNTATVSNSSDLNAANNSSTDVAAVLPRPGKAAIFSAGSWYIDQNSNLGWNGAPPDRAGVFGQAGDVPLRGDWTGGGADSIGVFRNGVWYLDLNNNLAWDGPGVDRQASFGVAGFIPVVGDWNGDGTTKIGCFDPNTGAWYLDWNGNGVWDGPGVDKFGFFGVAGFVPVVGDWNGDGKTDIGVFNPANGAWYLDANGNYNWDGTPTDRAGFFGIAGFTPVVGDWVGDGKARVGVFNPANAAWYLDISNNLNWDGSPTDASGFFGVAGFSPLVGDWVGDGKARVGVFNPANAAWYFDMNGSLSWNGTPADAFGFFGVAGMTPIPARW